MHLCDASYSSKLSYTKYVADVYKKGEKSTGSFLKFRVMPLQWLFFFFFFWLSASQDWKGEKPGINVGHIELPNIIWRSCEQILWTQHD